MDYSQFLTNNQFIAFDASKYHHHHHHNDPHAAFSSRVFYEWNAKLKKYTKFKDEDPDPPNDLPPGKFDGNIIEVDRVTLKPL